MCCLHHRLWPRRTYQDGSVLSCTEPLSIRLRLPPRLRMNLLSHWCPTLASVSGTDHCSVVYMRGRLATTDLDCTWISLEFVKCVLLKKKMFANICTWDLALFISSGVCLQTKHKWTPSKGDGIAQNKRISSGQDSDTSELWRSQNCVWNGLHCKCFGF